MQRVRYHDLTLFNMWALLHLLKSTFSLQKVVNKLNFILVLH